MYLFGLRIIDGRSEKGAGLFVNNALVDISESQISNNQTAGQGSQGGGIYAFNSRVGLYGSYVETNYSDDLPGYGAGIFSDNSILFFESAGVSDNNSSSGSGGGVYMTNNSEGYFVETEVRDNTALKQGGGIFINEGSYLNADGAINIHDNTVTQDCFTGQGSQGGGFFIDNASVDFSGDYLYANKAFDSGGAFFLSLIHI